MTVVPPLSILLYQSMSTNIGQKVAAGQTLPIGTEVITPNGPAYRRVLYLAIPRDEYANTIALNAPVFIGSFYPKILTTGQQSGYLEEPWQFQDNKVVAHFKRPWHVHTVNTSGTGKVEFYRVDGEAVADEASAGHYSSGTNATELTQPEFVSHHFAMQFIPMSKNPAPGIEKVADSSTSAGGDGVVFINSGNQGLGISSGSGNSPGKNVQLQSESPAYFSFHNIHSIELNSYPTTPRIMVPSTLNGDFTSLASDPEIALDLLWQEAGEWREAVAADLASVLEAQLLQKIAAAFAATDSSEPLLWVPLVLESDTPCDWKLTNLALPCYFVVNRFQDDSNKFTLDFSANEAPSQELPLAIPPGNINLTSFRVDIANQDQLFNRSGNYSENNFQGFMLTEDYWYACRLLPSMAGFYGAVTLLCSVLSNEIALEASLLEDSADPNGKALFTGSATVTKSGRQQWITLKFGQYRLDSKNYWLKVKATKGQGIWVCAQANGATVKRGQVGSPSATPEKLAPLQPLAEVLEVNNGLNSNSPLFDLQADGSTVALQLEDNQVYNVITPQTLSAASKLVVLQAAKGKLIFSQPRIEYSS